MTVPIKSFKHLKVGDTVIRMLAGTIPMKLRVTAVTIHRIKCGVWEFDRNTGVEEDEDMKSGVRWGRTISFLVDDPDLGKTVQKTD